MLIDHASIFNHLLESIHAKLSRVISKLFTLCRLYHIGKMGLCYGKKASFYHIKKARPPPYKKNLVRGKVSTI